MFAYFLYTDDLMKILNYIRFIVNTKSAFKFSTMNCKCIDELNIQYIHGVFYLFVVRWNNSLVVSVGIILYNTSVRDFQSYRTQNLKSGKPGAHTVRTLITMLCHDHQLINSNSNHALPSQKMLDLMYVPAYDNVL